MNRLSLSLLAALFAALFLVIAGCGSSEPKPDPQVVLTTALSPASLDSAPGTEAKVEVESLADDGRVLESRTLPVSSRVLRQLEEALVLSDTASGSATDAKAKAPAVVKGLKAEDSTEVEGVPVDHISGDLDVKGLVSGLEKVAGTSDGKGQQKIEVPGLAGLTDIEDSITAADFDIYAAKDGGSLQQVELTLTLASTNSLPPTRIRFRLSGVQADQGN